MNSMTLGRMAYLIYFRPLARARACVREGGPIEQMKTERGRREMEAAAWRLSCIRPKDEQPSPRDSVRCSQGQTKTPAAGGGRQKEDGKSESGGESLEIHMLVGRRFWFMAAYALVSLERQIKGPLHVHFYDDGTLEVLQRKKLETLASKTAFHDRQEIDSRIERWLPQDRFPFIRERLRNYPNLKKLTDPHVGSSGPKLVLDADVLFFRPPTELLQWIGDSSVLLCATDMKESYGYSRPLLGKLAGAPVPELINVGITGLRSETLDWEQLERWCRELISREKTNYYLEQALVAMLCAKRPYKQLGLARYITGPEDSQVLSGEGAMQHYVDLSKKDYFRHAWRQFTAV